MVAKQWGKKTLTRRKRTSAAIIWEYLSNSDLRGCQVYRGGAKKKRLLYIVDGSYFTMPETSKSRGAAGERGVPPGDGIKTPDSAAKGKQRRINSRKPMRLRKGAGRMSA